MKSSFVFCTQLPSRNANIKVFLFKHFSYVSQTFSKIAYKFSLKKEMDRLVCDFFQ